MRKQKQLIRVFARNSALTDFRIRMIYASRQTHSPEAKRHRRRRRSLLASTVKRMRIPRGVRRVPFPLLTLVFHNFTRDLSCVSLNTLHLSTLHVRQIDNERVSATEWNTSKHRINIHQQVNKPAHICCSFIYGGTTYIYIYIYTFIYI